MNDKYKNGENRNSRPDLPWRVCTVIWLGQFLGACTFVLASGIVPDQRERFMDLAIFLTLAAILTKIKQF